MFDWKTTTNRDSYFRVVYVMQGLAVIAASAGLFLAWWRGSETANAIDLMRRSLDKLIDRDPDILAEPLGVLWFIWPVLFVSAMRSFSGVLVQPVTYRRLALAAWAVAALALAHFYINFTDEDLVAGSALVEGYIQFGFWVTAVATAFLGVLILVEFPLGHQDTLFVVKEKTGGPVEDAERLWRGEYLTCPYCGMLNKPGVRKCYNCHNLLFDFRDDKEQ